MRSFWNETYTTTSTGDPAPVVEFATEVRDQVGGVIGIGGLDQMVVVVLCALSHDRRVRGIILIKRITYTVG